MIYLQSWETETIISITKEPKDILHNNIIFPISDQMPCKSIFSIIVLSSITIFSIGLPLTLLFQAGFEIL